MPKAQREARAREMLALVDLAGFDSRRICTCQAGRNSAWAWLAPWRQILAYC